MKNNFGRFSPCLMYAHIPKYTYKYPRRITPSIKVKLLLYGFGNQTSFALHHYPVKIIFFVN